MKCRQCDTGIITRGIKIIVCPCCGKEKLVGYEQVICENCSNKKNICQNCGRKVHK